MKKALVVILLLGILIFGLGVTAYFVVISMPSTNQENVVVVIQNGDGVDNVAMQLKSLGLIKSKLAFKTYLFINNKISKIQPGEYQFNQVNVQKIASKITQPPEYKQEIVLTFLEGWNSDEMGAYLQEKGLSFEQDFLKLAETRDTRNIIPDKDYAFFLDKPLNIGLEGYLFPDTYRVFEDVTPEEIVEKMLDNFDEKFNEELREKAAEKDLKISEVITLASIVEKEARTKEDKKVVAGIFLNRIVINQRLESDATVNYITGKQTTRPSYKDLEADSLYNTYKYSGLPPGPICNPGMDSIEAVIYPEDSDYLYFLNTPSGNIIYNKTYEDHLETKNEYYD